MQEVKLMALTKKVIIDKKKCKGCQLCLDVCPVDIIKMAKQINDHGYHPAEVKEQEKMSGLWALCSDLSGCCH